MNTLLAHTYNIHLVQNVLEALIDTIHHAARMLQVDEEVKHIVHRLITSANAT